MSKIKNWQCEECGKELKLEKDCYSKYEGEDKCLACRGEKFAGEVERTAGGKERKDILTVPNRENYSNKAKSFKCNNCDEELLVEKTMYDLIYKDKDNCWDCRHK